MISQQAAFKLRLLAGDWQRHSKYTAGQLIGNANALSCALKCSTAALFFFFFIFFVECNYALPRNLLLLLLTKCRCRCEIPLGRSRHNIAPIPTTPTANLFSQLVTVRRIPHSQYRHTYPTHTESATLRNPHCTLPMPKVLSAAPAASAGCVAAAAAAAILAPRSLQCHSKYFANTPGTRTR